MPDDLAPRGLPPDGIARRETGLATRAQAADWDMERMRQRLEAVEARLGAPPAPEPPTPGLAMRLLPAMAGMAVAALALIAGTLVWQVTHPVPLGQPTVVVNNPPPMIHGTAPTGIPAGVPAGTAASTQMPSFRAPGLVLPPRPALRGYYPRG